jgi:hypothetical protein
MLALAWQRVSLSRLAIVLACLLFGATPEPSFAQSTNPPTLGDFQNALARHYEKPVDIRRLLSDWEQLGAPRRDAMMGFLAGIFAKSSREVDLVTAANLGRSAQVVVIQGLRLADRHPDAVAAAKRWGWPPEQMAPITPVRPLRSLIPEQASSFDVLWAASFATGDSAYVRPIYDFYDATASTPGIDVRDIVAIVILRSRRDKGALDAIKKKYALETFVRIIHASSALWSLESNSRQHKFVAVALNRFTQEKPTSPAAEGLAELRKAVAATLGSR